ncbi:MAG: hypothetical protein IIZ09_10635 [Ruminococcus sp.]|nr:hypothetical protein [Ruminococcus sp.]
MKNSKTFAALAAAIMAVSSMGVMAVSADTATESAAPVATESVAPAETESKADAPAESEAAPVESKAEESKAEESKAEESKAEESKAEESKADDSKAEESKAEESKTESKADESKTESKAAESKKDDTSSEAPITISKILYDAFTGNEFTFDANGKFLAAYSAAGARLDNVKPAGILYGYAGEDKKAGDIIFYDASNGLKVVKTVVRSSVTGSVADFAKTTINDMNKTASKTTGTTSKTESKKDNNSSKSEEKKKDNPKTGNTAANSVVGLVTLAGAAAVAVISRKERD